MTAETPVPVTTTTESRPVMRHRGACTCTWRGPWREKLEQARLDSSGHRERSHR